MSKESGFLRWNLLLVDAVKIVEITRTLGYYINLADKAATGLRGLTPILKKFYCGEEKSPCCREIICERRINVANFILGNCHSPPTFSNPHPYQSAATNIKARPSASKGIATH